MGLAWCKKISELSYKVSGFSPTFTKKLSRLSPKLIHAHFGPDAVRAVPLAKQLNIPLVVTFHGYELTIKPSYAWRASFSQFVYFLHKNGLKKESCSLHCSVRFYQKIFC